MNLKNSIRLSIIFIILSITQVYAVPISINYQGYITTSQGLPLESPSIKIIFKLYNTLTSEIPLWIEEHPSVSVSKGYISVILGELKPLTSIVLSNDNLYLGISVNDDPEMKPRQQLASAVFTIRAAVADTVIDGAITTEKIADNAITASKIQKGAVQIFDPDGNFKVEGFTSVKEMTPNYSPDPENGYDRVFGKSPGVDFSSDSTLIQQIVLYWKFDDKQGSQVTDSVEIDHATAFNDPLIVDGKMGYARFFDASKEQYISKHFPSKLNFGTGNFSIAFWMKAITPTDWSVVISKANRWGTGQEDYGWLFGNADESAATLEFRINACGTKMHGHKVVRAENVFDNNWHHVVGVKNNTQISLYIDGTSVDTQTEVIQSVNIDTPLEIGALSNGYYYSGYIDNLAIWNRSLSDSEIKELASNLDAVPTFDGGLYYVRSDGVELSLQGHWKKEGEDIHYKDGNIHVNGGVKVGAVDDCNADVEGMVRYNSEIKTMEFCNGEQWLRFYDPPPKMPGEIVGSRDVCGGMDITYSVEEVESATYYSWSVPSGASIKQGSGTNSIVVDFGNASSGDVCVVARNVSGDSGAKCTTISICDKCFPVMMNGKTFYKVKVNGAMNDTNVYNACINKGLKVACNHENGGTFSDNLCEDIGWRDGGSPMLTLSKFLCNGENPNKCIQLDGVFQYMGHKWNNENACGTLNGGWCVTGSDQYALCFQ